MCPPSVQGFGAKAGGGCGEGNEAKLVGNAQIGVRLWRCLNLH